MAEKNARLNEEPIDDINDDEFEDVEKKINVSELMPKASLKAR